MKKKIITSGPRVLNYLYTGDAKRNKLPNSENQRDIPHYMAFHQGLLCLLSRIGSSEKYIIYFLNYNL